MMRPLVCVVVTFTLWLAMARTATAQAAVEAGLGAARAATSTAPAKGLGKSIGGVFGSLDKTLKTEQPATSTPSKPATRASSQMVTPTATPATTASPNAPAEPAPSREDPSGIEAGLSYDDLVHRFGPASMAITNGAERSLTYRGKDGLFRVKVRDGAVASVERPQ